MDRQPTLAQVQSQMADGVVLLAFGFGEHASLALSMERDRVDVRLVGSAQIVRDAASSLREAVRTPDTSMDQVTAAATRLSAILIDGDVPRLPGRLIVLSDTLLDGAPLSLLTWPGQPQWLAETTPTAVMVTFPDAMPSEIPLASEIHVITAMSEGASPSAAGADRGRT